MEYRYYKKITGAKRESLPTAVGIIYILTALTAVFHALSVFSEGFSDFVNMKISVGVRFILAHITNFVPFSIAETLLILLPVWAFLLIYRAVKYYSDSWKRVLVYIGKLFAVVCVIYMIFFWGYGVGYGSPEIGEKLGLERADVSAEELYDTAVFFAGKVNGEAENVTFRKENFSVMPYTIKEMNEKLEASYKKFTETSNAVSKLSSNLKPVMLSEPMSYTHITGVYSFFTGEANINVVFPDYTIPYTAAHELAHQRGIARENEANFIAFLVCAGSDDAYIRYSGYQNMLEYVLDALYRADTELYKEAVKSIDMKVRYEMSAYSKFFDKYRDSTAGKVSGAVNDTYLKLNRTEGEKSYGMVVDFAVAYRKKEASK